MINLSVTINPAELARFESNLQRMQDETGREMKIVVRNAARDCCRAAIGHTIMAPYTEKRKFIMIHHRYSGKPITISVPAYSKYINTRGFAKAGWSACLSRLGVERRSGGKAAGNIRRAAKIGIELRQSGGGRSSLASTAMKYSKVEETASRGEIGMLVANEIPFIEDMDAGRNRFHTPLHVLEKSIADVNSKMEKYLADAGKNVARKSGF